MRQTQHSTPHTQCQELRDWPGKVQRPETPPLGIRSRAQRISLLVLGAGALSFAHGRIASCCQSFPSTSRHLGSFLQQQTSPDGRDPTGASWKAVCSLSLMRQEPLGIDRRHTSGSRCTHGLSIRWIRYITSSEHTFDVCRRAVRLRDQVAD